MPTFNVVLKEKSIRYATVEVEATDWEDAEKLAMGQYYDNQILFEYDSDVVEIEEVEELTL